MDKDRTEIRTPNSFTPGKILRCQLQDSDIRRVPCINCQDIHGKIISTNLPSGTVFQRCGLTGYSIYVDKR